MNRSEILAKRLLENEQKTRSPGELEPNKLPNLTSSADIKDEIDRLMPVREYRFIGNSMWNAAGMLNLAVRPFTVGTSRADQKWGIKIMRAMNAPEHVIDALINGRAEIDPAPDQPNDAIVTVKLYDEGPKIKSKIKIRRPPAAPV